MARLIVRVPGQPQQERRVGSDPVTIGRAADCELVVEDEGVSRRHAVIRRSDDGFEIEDLGSRNGTLVDGRSVERHALADGDRVQLGPRVELEWRDEEVNGPTRGVARDDARERLRRAVRDEPRASGRERTRRGGREQEVRDRRAGAGWMRRTEYWLRPVSGRRRKAALRLSGHVVTVGREKGAGLVVDDESISRLHARFDRDGGALFVTDLKSRNGVRVNDEPVVRAELEDGDVVAFGDVAFEVQRRERVAWYALGRTVALFGALVALGWAGWWLFGAWQERALIDAERKRVRQEVVASLAKGIAASREGNADYARSYLLYAADAMLVSDLAPIGASLDRARELFGAVLRDLPPEDRNFDFARALDPAALTVARARLEGLSNPEYVERQVRRLAIELGADQDVPQGFIDEVRDVVERWSQSKGFQRILDRSRTIHPRIRPLVKAAHLPEPFCYVAWIESALDPRIQSRVGAVGLWQLMPATARELGLKVGGGFDERTDVERSTRAGTAYIANLLRKFGREQFMLALASYNRGPYGVWNAMEKIQDPMMPSSKKYWYMVENRLLPEETSHYVPRIFAAQILAEDPARFGFDPP